MVGNKLINFIFLSYATKTNHNTASFNRTLGYAKGLQKKGYNVLFLFASSPQQGIQKLGKIRNVIYEFIGDNRNYNSKIERFISQNMLFNKTSKRILEEKITNNKTVVKIPVGNPFLSAKYLKFCKKNRIYTFQERSEFPSIGLKAKGIKKIKNLIEYKYYIKKVLPRIDFMVLMTKTLIDYYSKLVNKQAKLFHMPMTVDVERFINVQSYNLGYKYIAYCGSMNKDKDGVHILVDAFSNIIKKHKGLKLLLIGPRSPKKDYQEIHEIIKKNNIENEVIFTGQIERNEIPAYLMGAEALCLARPESQQALGGFPTKLGEYLLTGKPVVVTKVGEIPDYLSDGINCFMAEPNSIDSFYNKLSEALTNKKKITIGINGKKTAMNVFNSLIQSKRLGEFFEQNI